MKFLKSKTSFFSVILAEIKFNIEKANICFIVPPSSSKTIFEANYLSLIIFL